MRTEDDLRAACTALADRAPAPDETRVVIPAQAPGPVGHSRRSLLVGVAAATAMAAVATPVIIRTAADEPQGSLQPTVDPNDWRRPIMTLEPPAGWYRTSTRVSIDSVRIVSTNGPGPQAATCMVEAYPRGSFDAKRISAGSARITINGRPGYFGAVGADWARRPRTSHPAAVVWEYESGKWAMSTCGDSVPSARTVMRQLAEGSRFGVQPFTVPVAIGYLPRGMHIQYAMAEPDPPFGRRPTATVGLSGCNLCPIPPSDEQLSTLIEVRPEGEQPDPGPDSTRTAIGGRHAWFYRSGQLEKLQIQDGGFYVTLALGGARPNIQKELRTMAEHLRLARDPADPSTWFDSIDALPQ